MVALEHVSAPLPDEQRAERPSFVTSMGIPDWVDKRRDILHMTYPAICDTRFPLDGGDPVHFLFSEAPRARDISMTRSLLPWVYHNPDHFNTIRNQSLLVCLRFVTIHAPLQPALDSGLFGLLGDARVVLVDEDDIERKRQYRAFWEAHGIGTDKPAALFFDKDCERVGAREELAMEKTARLFWEWTRTKDQIVDGDTAFSSFSSGDEEQLLRWGYYPFTWSLNRKHPWVRDTVEAMPELRQTVMFRLCTQNCPEKEQSGWSVIHPDV